MNNSIVLLMALTIIALVMVIALMPKTKICDINIGFSLQNGFIITFGTNKSNNTKMTKQTNRVKKNKKTSKTNKTNVNPPKDKR